MEERNVELADRWVVEESEFLILGKLVFRDPTQVNEALWWLSALEVKY